MKRMIVILGPTACGKTTLAATLASRIGGEVVSADSRQVYRGMDIGTGKDLADYTVDGHEVPYHLIDIRDAGTRYNLFEYQQDFLTAYQDITSRGARVVLCGGTGLYVESVVRGYHLSPVPQNPGLRKALEGQSLEALTGRLRQLKARNGSVMHNTTDVDSAQRAVRAIEIEEYNSRHPLQERAFPTIPSLVFGVDISREDRRRRITERLKARLEEGMVEEIRSLLARGVAPEDLIYYGLEYKYVTEYVTGKLTKEEMFRSLEIAIHQFAKRQMTWFRGMERRGQKIHWIDFTLPLEEKIAMIIKTDNDESATG